MGPGIHPAQSVNRARMGPVKLTTRQVPLQGSPHLGPSQWVFVRKRAPSSLKPQSGQQHDKEHPPVVSLATGARANKLAEADL